MKVRVYISGSFAPKNLRKELHDALAEYYGEFDPSDIDFYCGYEENSIYITGEVPSKYSSSEIIRSIRMVLGYKTEIYLNSDDDLLPANPISSESVPLYPAESPLYTFDQLILPDKTMKKIKESINMILPEVKNKVFNEWGLKHMIPYAFSALSLYGPPGTGKSMAAEAIAHKLGKKIIRASYAELTSKYFGEGSKRVKAIFDSAEDQDAVLFIDEADSLLSKRLADVTDASGNAINSMRSQLLLSIERFDGIVVFATNLVVNYDRAFISRLISIEIPPPDFHGRKAIWEQHIRGSGINIPLEEEVSVEELAKNYDSFCGREIKKAVMLACTAAAADTREPVTQADFRAACKKVQAEARELAKARDYTQQNTPRLTLIS